MIIITHRGLDPSKKEYFAESSREAFEDQLARGFGLEFDLQSTKDNEIVILHDGDLSRTSNGTDLRTINELTIKELSSIIFSNSHIASLPEIIKLIKEKSDEKVVHAIHLKHSFQTRARLDTLLENLHGIDYKKYIIFDTTIETAKYLKERNSKLNLAPSVAHPFDIERYNYAVGGTLLSIDDVLKNRELFDWVWLDEWDLVNIDGGTKKLYTKEIFSRLRDKGFKIALISPELHAVSPGLLGGEIHPDARTMEQLEHRLHEIIALEPDVICTDYPDLVKKLTLM